MNRKTLVITLMATALCLTQGFAADLQTSEDAAVARTGQGLVAGYVEDGVYTFKGVPYAKAERFMPPQEADPWEGVRSSRAYGPNCPQGTRSAWKTDELAFAFDWEDWHADEKNCLCINVWTAGLEDGGKRPVMVWMHPGGFTGGSGNEMPCYDGTNLAKNHGVVVVTFNQRLNELGFLDLSAYGEEYAESGNVGMLDAVAALKWVRDNIGNFGGDPGNVTIFGQSGGGGKVATLMAMPSARGLFHRAIVQSGSMINTMERKYARMIADSTLRNLGLDSTQVDKLRRLPYSDLHKAGQKAIKQVRPIAKAEGAHSFIFGWAPVVDGAVLPFQPSSPEAMELSSDIPLIVGSTKHEFPNTVYTEGYRNPTMEQARALLEMQFGERTDEFIELYRLTYGDTRPKDLIDTDFEFRPNVLNFARRKSAAGGAPVYVYMFEWEAPVLDGLLRSVHCSDIPYVFDNVQIQKKMTGGGPEAQVLADKMSGAWTDFARTGNPTPDREADPVAKKLGGPLPGSSGGPDGGVPASDDSNIIPASDRGLPPEPIPTWEPYTEETGATMIFGKNCRIVHGHDTALMDFICSFPVRGITTLQE